jgi:hypothetical protein
LEPGGSVSTIILTKLTAAQLFKKFLSFLEPGGSVSTVILTKLTAAQLFKRFLSFLEPGGSVQFSEELTTGHYLAN